MPAPVRSKRSTRFRFQPGAAAFFAAFLLVELAAFNTGENLLYLLAAICLAILGISILASIANLSGLDLSREAPDATHRDDAFGVEVRIANAKRFLPSFSLVLAFENEEWRPVAHLPAVPANAVVSLRLERTMRRRGVHPLPAIVLYSGYPMGLYRREFTYRDARQIVVYPRVHRLQRAAIDHLDQGGSRPRPTRASGDEYFSLREYIPGDDIRYICWRVSARLGQLIVRELEPGSVRSVVIVLDTRGVPDTFELEEKFERAIELAASLMFTLIERQYLLAIVTPQHALPLGQGEGHVLRALDLLARVAPANYGDHGDDWFRGSGDLGAAAKICIATDPGQWGGRGLDGSVRVADPDEVLYAH
jgi:uncharacterized protein (DUF58 family)